MACLDGVAIQQVWTHSHSCHTLGFGAKLGFPNSTKPCQDSAIHICFIPEGGEGRAVQMSGCGGMSSSPALDLC